MERLYKESVIKLNVSATTKPTAQTNVTFWSYDIDTARQTFEVVKNDKPISLVNASNITLVLQFAGLDNVIHLTPEIEDFENGIISIILPTETLGFEGRVTGGLFIKFENKQSFDCGYFVFSLRTSSIDNNVGDLADFYVQRFEDLQKIIEAKAKEILSNLETESERVMTEIEELYESIKGLLSEEVAVQLFNLIEKHKEESVLNTDGAHKLRVYDGKLQVYNGVIWIDVDVGDNQASSIFLSNGQNVEEALSGKAVLNHSHNISDVTDLQATLDGKAEKVHTHSASDLPKASTSGQGILRLNNTLTSTSLLEALTANQGSILHENKLDKTDNAVSASRLQKGVKINNVSFDGTSDIEVISKFTTHPLWAGNAYEYLSVLTLSNSIDNYKYLIFQGEYPSGFMSDGTALIMKLIPSGSFTNDTRVVLDKIQLTLQSTKPGFITYVAQMEIQRNEARKIKITKSLKIYIPDGNLSTMGFLRLTNVLGVY